VQLSPDESLTVNLVSVLVLSTQVLLTFVFQASPVDGTQILRKVGTALNVRLIPELEPLALATITDSGKH
jgi:hypothetical protein